MVKLTTFLFVVLALMMSFINCTGPKTTELSGTNSQADLTKLTPDCFVAENPSLIIDNDDFFSGANWNDPHVIQVGSQYVMYASADTNFSEDIKIYRLVSNDALTWSLSPSTPVLSKGTGGADWDRKSVETPAVVYFNGQYYMFYTGYAVTQSDSTSYQIGYATSADGITWTKGARIVQPSDPTGAPNMAFDQFVTAEPAPIVFNGKIYLYFTALGANASVGTTLQTIGLIESSDGVTWSAPQQVVIPDQTLYPRASNWKGYSTPHAAVLDNKVHLFVDVVTDSPFSQEKIHHMVSSDGKTNWIQDSTAIFDKSEFTWTTNQIRAPAVLLVGTSLFLWFAGDAGVSTVGIGLSRCSL